MLIASLPGSIRTSDIAQKVAAERKMKLQQGTMSLSQIATVTAKRQRTVVWLNYLSPV